MSDNDKIKADIEAKKKRLAQLRARKAAAAGKAGGATSARSPLSAASPARAAAPLRPATTAASVLSQVNKLVGVRGTMSSSFSQATHHIMPQEKHTYDKECQTEIGVKLEGKLADMEKQLREEQAALMQKEEKVKLLMEQLKIDKSKFDQMCEDERLKEPKELSPEEHKRVVDGVEFQNFFTKATRVMERALHQPSYDITRDYADDGDDGDSSSINQNLVQSGVFKDKKMTHRAVTCIDWSPKYPELMLASYAGQDDPMSFDPDGAVLVWNLHMQNRPEYSFNCNSAVLSAQFHPTNPKLVVGACQSGQIVIWDTREKSSPVNRTSLSHGHTHPVYALDTVSVVNKLHNILSVSTDGHLCVWSDNNLHNPSKEVRLVHGKEEITTTAFACPKGQTSILMGSDEGFVYKAHVYDNEGIYEAHQAHQAPITNVRCHPSQKNNNLADLYLTSSFDWTVKLWSNKVDRPLFTFESGRDYVLDVQWSPLHPALFAMGDGTGKLDLWNLNKDTEVPDVSTRVDSLSASGENAAISRVAWSDDGCHIAAGTSTGTLHVYKVATDYAQPAAEDATTFYDKVQKKLTSTSD